MKKNIFPKHRNDNILEQDLGNELLIYDLIEDKAFCLNEVSTLVWYESDGSKSVKNITENISRKLKNKVSEELVWFALDQLNERKLMVDETIEPSMFAGMTRREVIKKIGLTSMVALPMISSLMSPTAAQAQSACAGLPFGSPCNPATDTCCVGTNPGACTDLGSPGTFRCQTIPR